jgi:hypothetical protein
MINSTNSTSNSFDPRKLEIRDLDDRTVVINKETRDFIVCNKQTDSVERRGNDFHHAYAKASEQINDNNNVFKSYTLVKSISLVIWLLFIQSFVTTSLILPIIF